METYDRRMYIRKALSPFITPKDVIFLLNELFQQDPKVLKGMKTSLNEWIGKRGVKDFLLHLEDKILMMTDKKKEKWIHFCSFIDLIAFHCFRSHCTWKTFELTDSKLEGMDMEEFIHMRSKIKANLPVNNANSVQQLVSTFKGENENILYATFRIVSINVTKAMEKDPLKLQKQKLKSKPFFLVYFNGSPYAYSPTTAIKTIIHEGILGGFQCSDIVDMELTSKDLASLYTIAKSKSAAKREFQNTQLDDMETDRDADSPCPIKKIILNDLTIQSNPMVKKNKQRAQGVKGVLRIHGENIYEGLHELENLGIIKETSCSWINQLSSIKKNDLVLSRGRLYSNKNPITKSAEWHERLKSAYWKGI